MSDDCRRCMTCESLDHRECDPCDCEEQREGNGSDFSDSATVGIRYNEIFKYFTLNLVTKYEQALGVAR